MNFIPKIEYTSAPITIAFSLPPVGDFLKEDYKTSEKTSTSSNGTEQTQWNFNSLMIKPTMTFVDQATKDAYNTFFLDHASKGLSFKYFISNDEVEFKTVTLSRKQFRPTILFSSNVLTEFVYEWTMDMRELLT